ncbi:MAG: hypothetical protein AB7O59_01385 [Pirellulales bacterium]
MSKTRFGAALAMAAVMVAAVSTSAEAFCHRYRSVPAWFGVYYPGCGPCGGCVIPYVASGCYSGYGYCGIGCGGGCGYGYGCGGGCGYDYGCGYGCAKKIHRHAAHRAWKQYLRGCGSCLAGCGGCYDGCGSCGSGCGACYSDCGGCGGSCDGCGSSCGVGGCSGCEGGETVTGDGGNVIYDGPAPEAAPAPAADTSAAVRRPLIMLAGMRQTEADGSMDFERGLDAYRRGSMNDAARDFEAASAAEPNNALYHYYRALAMHDLYGPEAATDARQQAVEAELQQPISGWGKRMERVQGRARVWIEKARRDAGIVR